MQFLHPAFLLGLGAVAVPILIHLVYKVRARVVPFPSLRFLRQVDRQVARRQRLRELLLLALRCLALALLALALAAPCWKPSGGAAGSAGTAAVIVLDDSYSMQRREADGPLFARARGLARSILRSLAPGDAACVLTSAREPRLSRDPGGLAAALDGIDASMGDVTLRPLVEAGLKLLRGAEAAQRELYIVSDFQRRAADLDRVEWAAPDLSVVLVPVAPAGRDDLAVAALDQISPFATAAAPFRVRVTVANRGPEAAAGALKVRVDDRTAAEASVFVPAGGATSTTFDVPLDRAGWRAVSAELDDDALRADNRRWLCVPARPELRVLMIRPDTPGALPRSFYLEKAVNPAGAADTGVRIDASDPARLADADLDGAAVVFLVECLPPSEEAGRRLRAYVAAGGSLVIVAGPSLDADAFNEALAADAPDGGPLSPARLAGTVGDDRDPSSYLSIREVDLRHPLFARLQGAGAPIDWGTAAFYRAVRAEPLERSGAGVIARFGGGLPALVERPFGLGRVMLFASALHTDTTTLPLKVGFVPLVHSLVATLSNGGRAEGLRVGERLRLVLPAAGAPAAAKLVRESGAPLEARGAVREGQAVYDFGPVRAPGAAAFEWVAPSRLESRKVAVNVNPGEGVQDYADPAAVVPWAHRVRDAEELGALLASIRFGRNLGTALLLLALAVALAESVLANRFAFGGLGRGDGAQGAPSPAPATVEAGAASPGIASQSPNCPE